jgi:phosphoribosylformylglycinamidine synthase II
LGEDDFTRLETVIDTGNPELTDAGGESLRKAIKSYFGMEADSVRHVQVLSIDSYLDEEARTALMERVTNPVIHTASYEPLFHDHDLDYVLWVGFKPGVKDNLGDAGKAELRAILGDEEAERLNASSSNYFVFRGPDLTEKDIEHIGTQLKANPYIEDFEVYSSENWDNAAGIGNKVRKVESEHKPSRKVYENLTVESLNEIVKDRRMTLNPRDVPIVVDYYDREDVKKRRLEVGVRGATDLELEYICQARSDHCNHNTFRGKFYYTDLSTGEKTVINNLFKTCIEEPTLLLKDQRDDIISVLWDNCGVARFDEDTYYVTTGETHNSPSNKEAYGGSITGIVGVYRDPMGTGLGSKLILGAYGYCVGEYDYDGPLKLELHPRRLLDGVIRGVRDGGNKSGIPTPFGRVWWDYKSMGKSLVFVIATGMMPAQVKGIDSSTKEIKPGYHMVMCGGRVGMDGIHGVTQASEIFSEEIDALHVQIGDPYTQKKMQDFLIEARDEGLVSFITDNGGGGLSSSVGESAQYNWKKDADVRLDGAETDLATVPKKYEGLDPWAIWISESQERMTVAVKPEHLEMFMQLSRKHDVESTVIGQYNGTGQTHIKYGDMTVGLLDNDFFKEDFPQWEFEAEWSTPEMRGLFEPKLKKIDDYNEQFIRFLRQPNIASQEFIGRQYDHEVQGAKSLGPFCGVDNDVPNDAVILRPKLTSNKGLVFTQALNQKYSQIDAGSMAASSIDEAVRNALVVGGRLDRLTGIDNFCWPSVEADMPDAKFKAAQLIRANLALKELCLAYNIPLLSGKDSMYTDGNCWNTETEEFELISGHESMLFTVHTLMNDVKDLITPDVKTPGNLIYVLGTTKDELGGSEYYDMINQTGVNAPVVDAEENLKRYQKFVEARDAGYVVSAKNVKAGGLGAALFLMAAGGNMGMDVDLGKVIADKKYDMEETLLYSESQGRILVEVRPEESSEFENVMGNYASCIGKATFNRDFVVRGLTGQEIINQNIMSLKDEWKSTFADWGYNLPLHKMRKAA